ncbi:hypothetical protein IT398_02375 [Candidatus Nomurabacteria bacterium]|nr:hypothetical protein [Candidatus Nomurabacteria bacterium]
MLTLFIGPVIVIAVSALGISALLGFQLGRLEQRSELEAENYPALLHILQDKINRFYHGFSSFFKQLGHYLYFYSLLVLRRLVIWVRIILTLIEKRFSHLIESVRGKGVVGKRGAVSLFLADIAKK